MINLKVVSPQKVIFEKEVEMAVLPGAEGDFAAMENHSPFISSLRPGQMAIMANNQLQDCLLYTSPSPRDLSTSRMPSSA